ncbi:glutamate synthase subunit alpha [Candidatus Formimonas warabiya]|uniref:Glutamate synthase subunit alpha n=2 Tax=Formimonas warabiya TaxID=1761012 RepID=A0A3G1L2D2_FORW1|nr:glutamate synthase subunit alpha [Candidatus Formimonas warabiya]
MQELNQFPQSQGLYDPSMEKDACGLGFIADVTGKKSNEIVKNGLEILKSLTHRGATGSDPETGDGAGILIQLPHEFFVSELAKMDLHLPADGDYAVGMIFFPTEPNARYYCEGVFERILREENQELISWRDVPLHDKACGISAQGTKPFVKQIFIARNGQQADLFERKLYIVRKRVEKAINEAARPYTDVFFVCSLSLKTIVYKGQFLAHQIENFYPELKDERLKSAIAAVHQRYSTNTFPSWRLAHPYRYLSHNGEINTIRGNIKWVSARESVMTSKLFGAEFEKVLPIIQPDSSDSCNLDNIFELLVLNGYSIPHALKMLMPEAWRYDKTMPAELKAFYEYHEGLIEPWDGPATIVFSDGVQVGATLDRNGLRPARYVITKNNTVILASESGVLRIPEAQILKKGKLGPGKTLIVDTKEKRIIYDHEVKQELANQKGYAEWIKENEIDLKKISLHKALPRMDEESLVTKQIIFGYTEEELRRIIAPMAQDSKEAIGSMGNDAPLAVLSDLPQLLFNYFRQLFAQVTNPPIDPIREKKVMSLNQYLGRGGNILKKIDELAPNKFIELEQPILYAEKMEKIKSIDVDTLRSITIPIIFEADQYEKGLSDALTALKKRVEESISQGYRIVILSDRDVDRYRAPIPSLLAVSAVHNHLIQKKLRTKVDLIIETGEARDTFHMALLLGYGATAVYPYMALETINHLVKNQLYLKNITVEKASMNYVRSLGYGIRKITSKMGISTLRSFNGAQIFEVIGLNEELVKEYFAGTPCRLSGLKMDGIAKETLLRHHQAFEINVGTQRLAVGGDIHYRKNNEAHLFRPDTIAKLQHACRTQDYHLFKEYSRLIDDQSKSLMTIRGLLKFKEGQPVPLDEVEPVESILKRFATGAMSFGSISKEVHETLAIAMNRMGGKSNSGEGGEDEARYIRTENGDFKASAIKQVAAARFGVTANYLVHADELQIKMAQGAKPGEGGHLPGSKVTEEIARVRHSLPGIDLISPPPHHDIYSIEDLEQLIFDLKNINPKARVSVKLVSEAGVGTVAAGVAKGSADMVLISGHDGGTGASPVSSIKTAGIPWEIGLAETQQTLLLNNLRSRIAVQVDGQMRTGRDVAISILLGAEEFGFSTAALVVCGCIMMRKCHNNTCPVGVATQDPELRKYFQGKPEHVINFFGFIARELREIMADLGFRTVDEMVGRVDMLEVNERNRHWKTKELDLSAILYRPELPVRFAQRKTEEQKNQTRDILDRQLIELAQPALEKGEKVQGIFEVKNTDRTIGAMLSGEVAKRYGSKGLPQDTIDLTFIGTAGQSFGAFAAPGITLRLYGDANDYVGKGLSGGRIIIALHKESSLTAEENIIAGNTILYGATSGEAYINGKVGERFAVRNSGAAAVVEGVGDHGCEYMTGGRIVILGETGRNFGAGMSGGIAYVLDEQENLSSKCNFELTEMEPLTQEDLRFVKNLVENHVRFTNSQKGKKILDHWQAYMGKFVRIISPQYREITEKSSQITADSLVVKNNG